jgi:hypothetical protein
MNALKRILVAVVAMFAITTVASAQFAIGPRVGANVNSMKFNSGLGETDNLAGFNAGIEAEFTIPVINLGFDASVMYVHRKVSTDESLSASVQSVLSDKNVRSRDYIEIPINLKYKIGLPLIGKIVTPYVFTGPSISVLASKKAIENAIENKSVDVAWNVGAGLQLFSHLQIGASYGFGMTNTVQAVSNYLGDTSNSTSSLTEIEGKNNYWTITAAWLF